MYFFCRNDIPETDNSLKVKNKINITSPAAEAKEIMRFNFEYFALVFIISANPIEASYGIKNTGIIINLIGNLIVEITRNIFIING